MKLLPLITLMFFSIASMDALSEETGKSKEDIKNQLTIIQDEINDLVDQGGKYAYIQLARKNGLSPFALGRESDGKVVMMEVPKSEEKASFNEKVYKLRQMLRLGADAGKFVSAALFVGAKVPHQGKDVDGVAIEMEHKTGMSVLRFSPYEIDRENKKIKFKTPVDKAKPAVFFVKTKDTSSAEKSAG